MTNEDLRVPYYFKDPLFIGCDDGLEGFDDFGDIAADEQDDITDDPLNSINVSRNQFLYTYQVCSRLGG